MARKPVRKPDWKAAPGPRDHLPDLVGGGRSDPEGRRPVPLARYSRDAVPRAAVDKERLVGLTFRPR